MVAYGAIGILAGLTGGLGNALVTSNLAYIQGTLGLGAEQAAWIPGVYVATNVCANLVLVKFRQEFGLKLFARLVLVGYILVTFTHLVVHSFWSVLLVRATSGIVAAGLTTLGFLAWFQAMPPAKRLYGIILGVSVPQLAIPLSRVMAPSLLEWGDWRMTYDFELGLALLTLAALLLLPLPPSERAKAFEPADFGTMALLFPGVGLMCGVLALGRTVWWTDAIWLGWMAIGAAILIGIALLLEHRRSNPLLRIDFLTQHAVLRICALAFLIRIVLAEQTFGNVGLLSSLGLGAEQVRLPYAIVTLASVAGIAVALAAFRPGTPARLIQAACVLTAIAAFMDSRATNLVGPAQLYVSQALVGCAAILFIGPAMIIGISRALLQGPSNFITWVVIFLATQNLGGLAGTALWGTVQTIRERYHSQVLVEQITLANPIDAIRLSGVAQQLGSTVADPAVRAAQAAALLGRQAAREANILAFSDVFLMIGFSASLLFLWSVAIELRMRRTGEVSPVVRFGQMVARIGTNQAERRP
jgi:MFS family permease